MLQRAIIDIEAKHSWTAFGYLTFGNAQILAKCLDSDFIARGREVLKYKHSLILGRFWNLVILLIQCYPESAQKRIQYFPEILNFIDDFCILRLVKVILGGSDLVAPFHFWVQSIGFVDTVVEEFARAQENKRDYYEILLPCCCNNILRGEFFKPTVLFRIMSDDSIYKFALLTPLVTPSNAIVFAKLINEAFSYLRPLPREFEQTSVGVLTFLISVITYIDRDFSVKCEELVSLCIDIVNKFPNHGAALKMITKFITDTIIEGRYRHIMLERMLPVFLDIVRDHKNIFTYAWAMNAITCLETAAMNDRSLRMDLECVPSYNDVYENILVPYKKTILQPYGGLPVAVNQPPNADILESAPITID